MKNAVYQIFTEGSSLLSFPYPPMRTEENTDYICFTNLKNIFSHFWKIIYIADLNVENVEEDEKIKNILSSYEKTYEIKPNQIIAEKIFEKENVFLPVIDVIPLANLPGITLDLSKMEPTKNEKGEYIYKKNPVYTGGKYEGHEYVLTIGVPVSNQIATIDRCLSHIKPILDNLDAELVVVDTGSTDGTIDVCRKYGARIVEFPWCDNMSAARNAGIYNAKGLWYMSIDDDEWFENVDSVIDFFKNEIYKTYDAAGYTQKNRLYKTADVFTENFAIRVAKITPELHFEGRIHDCLTIEGNPEVFHLNAVTYHEGFMREDVNKLNEKYRRNTEILLYDVYEYPAHPRYNYQLANEMANVGYYNEALGYFFRGVAIDMEYPDEYFGRQHATSILSTFYNATSERIFTMTELLIDKYRFTDAEKAYFYYNMADVGLRRGHNPEEILENYKRYVKYKNEYDKDTIYNDMKTFTGTHVCKNHAAITDGHVMGYNAYCRLGDTKNALCELSYIKPEDIFNETFFFVEGFLKAEEEVFKKSFDMVTSLQCEKWMEEFVYEFSKVLADTDKFNMYEKRLYLFLKKLSIKNTYIFAERIWEKLEDETKEEVKKGILTCDNMEENFQGLCFASCILKNYLTDRTDINKHMEIFFKYVQMTGCFNEKYYSERILSDDTDVTVPSEERAAYDIYMAMKYMENNEYEAAKAVEKMVERLRHALKSFPGFKTEISEILNILTGGK